MKLRSVPCITKGTKLNMHVRIINMFICKEQWGYTLMAPIIETNNA